jgi:hypothetical protein
MSQKQEGFHAVHRSTADLGVSDYAGNKNILAPSLVVSSPKDDIVLTVRLLAKHRIKYQRLSAQEQKGFSARQAL